MKILNKKAFSVVEYTVLFVIIIGAFLIMRTYIQQGVFGLWQQAGQAFAWGRQYDPQKTVDCGFDQVSGLWYDYNCFKSLSAQECSSGDTNCQEGIMNGTCSVSAASYCTQLNQ